MFIIFIYSCSDPLVNENSLSENEEFQTLIESSDKYSLYQIGVKHSWVKDLLETKSNLKYALKQKGDIDNRNIYYLEKEGLDDYFMYSDTVSGVLNDDGGYINVGASAEFIDDAVYEGFEFVRTSNWSSYKSSLESEGYLLKNIICRWKLIAIANLFVI